MDIAQLLDESLNRPRGSDPVMTLKGHLYDLESKKKRALEVQGIKAFLSTIDLPDDQKKFLIFHVTKVEEVWPWGNRPVYAITFEFPDHRPIIVRVYKHHKTTYNIETQKECTQHRFLRKDKVELKYARADTLLDAMTLAKKDKIK